MYHGDIRLGDTIDIKFCTVQSTGAPTTLAGTPVISAYVDNGTTEITAGITLTVDFDARTGLNNVRVVASSGNGFATGTNVQLVITTGTVNSVSAVGYVVGTFSIEKRSALIPTTGGRTLDVSATGEAGVDWANVGSPTTSLNLSGTTIGTLSALANNAVTAAAIATGAIDADALAADAVDEIWAKAAAEPGGVPAVTATAIQVLSWLLALSRNKITQTATTTTLRNDADSGTIAASTVSDDGTTLTRGEFA